MRRSGKTTRLIDDIVQCLFKNREVYLPTPSGIEAGFDGLPNGMAIFIDPDYRKGNFAQKDLTDKVLRRLDSEHKHQFMAEKKASFLKISLKSS